MNSMRFGPIPTNPSKLSITIVVSGSFLVAAIFSTSAQTVLFQHNGSKDPVAAEGWTQIASGTNVAAGPINDSGTSAWFVDDNSSDSSVLFYRQVPTAAHIASGSAFGWNLTLSLRVVDIPDSTLEGSPFGGYHNGNTLYAMDFGAEADGDPIIHLPTGLAIPDAGPSFTLQGGGGGYHLYRLIYDPASASADLFVDGVECISNYSGISTQGQSFVAWGAGTTFDSGQGNFSLVQFEVVPEPKTIHLAVLALLGAAPFFSWFKRAYQNRLLDRDNRR